MRVNIYAEEMTDRVEIISKEIDGHEFKAVRFYLELPVTETVAGVHHQIKGPFIHRPGDDDSAAVTFWGKKDLRPLLRQALALLDEHYAEAERPPCPTCLGCGQIADDEIGEPWLMWSTLPPGSDLAVRMGVVKPIPCPACGGKGSGQ